MSTPNDGGPAFPLGQAQYNAQGDLANLWQPGMTLRDYFAAKAMQGDWAAQNEEVGEFSSDEDDSILVERAKVYYRMADAMLAARAKAKVDA